MSERCPYLGLKESREEVALTAHPHHRCHYTREPQRIGGSFQVSTCLNGMYLRCPRLATRLPLKARVPPPRPAALMPTVRPAAVRYTELKPIRRRLTAFQFLIVCLILSLIAATLSLGYVVSGRLQRELDAGGVVARVTATQSPPSLAATAAPALLAVPVAEPTRTATAATASATATDVLPSPSPTNIPPSATPAPTLLPATDTPLPAPAALLPPTRLVIAKIGLDIPVKTVGAKEITDARGTRIVWDAAANAGAFHNTSAYPGNSGNIVINGHRDIQGSVFAHLDKVGVGDEILVYVGDAVYTYRVTQVLIVPETYATAEQRAQNLKLLGETPEERLTLVTCTPVGLATHRLVVIAEPAE